MIKSQRRPNLVKTDLGEEFHKNIIQLFFNKKNNKNYSRNACLGAAFAERSNRTIRVLLKGLVFELGNGNWTDVLPT